MIFFRPERATPISPHPGIRGPSSATTVRARALALLVGIGFAIPTPPTLALDPERKISQYRWQHWTVDEGLPQSSVLTLLHGRDGYLFFGTEEGLVRFDGRRFRVFDRQSLPIMRSNIVTAIAETEGRLFIGTPEGLLSRSASGDRWWTTVEGLPSDRIQTLRAHRDGSLWIGTLGGVARWHPGLESFLERPELASRLGSIPVTEFALDPGSPPEAEDGSGHGRSESLFIATERGLFRWTEGALRRFGTAEGLPDERILTVLAEGDGSVWVGTRGGLCRLRGESCSRVDAHARIDPVEITTLARDSRGHLFIGTNGHGISRYHLPSGRIESLREDDPFAWSLIRHLVIDDRDQLFGGAAALGLFRLSDAPFVPWGRREGLPTDDVLTVLEDSKKRLWAGTLGSGLVVIESDSEPTTFGTEDGLSTGNVWALYEDRGGTLWIGTYGGGLDRRLEDGTIEHFGNADGLQNPYVRAIIEDSHGYLWIATRGGLHRSNHPLHSGAGPRPRFERIAGAQIFGVDDIYSLHLDPEGELWIGGREGVLARHTATGFDSLDPADGVPRGRIYDIEDSRVGGLWLATSDGLGHLAGGRVRSIGSREGLLDDRIFTVVPDGQGRLWMTCNRGIFSVREGDLESLLAGNRQRVEARIFGTESGLRKREAVGGAQPAGQRLSDGRLAFPTIAGLATVDPGNVAPPPTLPRAAIEEIRVEGEDKLGQPRESSDVPVVLGEGADRLEVTFSAPTFTDANMLIFRYRLDGYSDDWIETGDRRFAQFTRVPPGDYRFEVEASRRGSPWGPAAVVPLRVLPRFYQTWLFRALAITALILGIFAAHRLAVRRLRRNEERLQARVRAAIAELEILEGLLPICAQCKNIRDENGEWNQLESYITDRSKVDFSHGLCPDCLHEVDPEIAAQVGGRRSR